MFIEHQPQYNISFDEINQGIIMNDVNYSFLDFVKLVTVAGLLSMIDTVLFIAQNYWYECLAIIYFYSYRYRLYKFKRGFLPFPPSTNKVSLFVELWFLALIRYAHERIVALYLLLFTITDNEVTVMALIMLLTNHPLLFLSYITGTLVASLLYAH